MNRYEMKWERNKIEDEHDHLDDNDNQGNCE